MSDLTLGKIKAAGNGLDGHCVTEGCRTWFGFDLDKLIVDLGPDWVLPEFVPEFTCTECGGPLKFYLVGYPPGAGVGESHS
jgi:hypothetical protein